MAHIFLYSDWNNSVFGHFSRSDSQTTQSPLLLISKMKKIRNSVKSCVFHCLNFIVNCLKHNANTVYAFISKIISFAKNKTRQCYCFSDKSASATGAASQYKNYKNLKNCITIFMNMVSSLNGISLLQVKWKALETKLEVQ